MDKQGTHPPAFVTANPSSQTSHTVELVQARQKLGHPFTQTLSELIEYPYAHEVHSVRFPLSHVRQFEEELQVRHDESLKKAFP